MSDVRTTSEALLAWAAARTAERKPGLSPSAIGGCRKRAGYLLAKTPPTNPGESVVAAIGSAIHDKVAEALRIACPDDLIEHKVEFAGIPGTLDRYRRADTTVCDTKTKSSRWLEHIKLHGPDHSEIWQVSIYAAGLVQQKHRVTHIELQYVARDTGEEWVYRQLFNPEDVRAALQWVRDVRDMPLEMLPRDFQPDSGYCRNCSFLDTCWGDQSSDGRPRVAVQFSEDPDADSWASKLWEARNDRKDAEQRETKAKGALEAIRPDGGTGRIHTGTHTIDFRTRGIYFVAGDDPQPAVGFQEGDAL